MYNYYLDMCFQQCEEKYNDIEKNEVKQKVKEKVVCQKNQK